MNIDILMPPSAKPSSVAARPGSDRSRQPFQLPEPAISNRPAHARQDHARAAHEVQDRVRQDRVRQERQDQTRQDQARQDQVRQDQARHASAADAARRFGREEARSTAGEGVQAAALPSGEPSREVVDVEENTVEDKPSGNPPSEPASVATTDTAPGLPPATPPVDEAALPPDDVDHEAEVGSGTDGEGDAVEDQAVATTVHPEAFEEQGNVANPAVAAVLAGSEAAGEGGRGRRAEGRPEGVPARGAPGQMGPPQGLPAQANAVAHGNVPFAASSSSLGEPVAEASGDATPSEDNLEAGRQPSQGAVLENLGLRRALAQIGAAAPGQPGAAGAGGGQAGVTAQGIVGELAQPNPNASQQGLSQALASLSEVGGKAAPTAPPATVPSAPVVPNVPLGAVPIEIGLKALAGVNHFQIRLDPAELGRIDVTLEIDADGTIKARLTVDRVETLTLLQRDARTLERAFEQAGLKPSDSGVDLSLRDQGRNDRGGSSEQGRENGENGRRNEALAHANGRGEATAAEPAAAQRTIWRGAAGIDVRI
jgi:flagellar hook-length control protein FliK